MSNDTRITDHDAVIAAARDDASREGARYVTMTIGRLWQLIQKQGSAEASEAPGWAPATPDRL